MEQFLTEMQANIQATVIKGLREKLTAFSAAIENLSGGKLSAAQVMDCWNKLHPDVTVSAPAASVPVASSEEKKSPRAKTDKDHKCPVIKQAGAEKGQPCGKNCVVGKDMCSAHAAAAAKKAGAAKAPAPVAVSATSSAVVVAPAPAEEKKAPAPVAATAPAVAAPVADASEEAKLRALTVEALKALMKAESISFTSKDRKDALIAKVLAAHAPKAPAEPSAAPVPAPAPAEPSAAPVPAPAAVPVPDPDADVAFEEIPDTQ